VETIAASEPGRRAIHLRRITCEGFARDDGLFDIEGTLIDTKPYDTRLPEKDVPAQAAIHHMTLRLTIDRQWTIRDAVARTLHGPYASCGEISASYRQLIGLRIEAGFTKSVKRMFRGTLGCSHLTELLPPMATTAFQMLWSEHDGPASAAASADKPNASPLGGCHVLRVDGPVAKLHFSHLVK
jgi:hypothetical protein